MTEVDTNEFIQQLEEFNDLKPGTLRTKGFKPFLNRNLTNLDPNDRQIVFETVQLYLSKSIDKSKERYARQRQRNKFQSRRIRSRGAVLYKRDVEQALLLARHQLLTDESRLSSKARDFIKDHCPCA